MTFSFVDFHYPLIQTSVLIPQSQYSFINNTYFNIFNPFSNFVIHNNKLYLAPFNHNAFSYINLTNISNNVLDNCHYDFINVNLDYSYHPNNHELFSDVILFHNRYLLYVPYKYEAIPIYDTSENQMYYYTHYYSRSNDNEPTYKYISVYNNIISLMPYNTSDTYNRFYEFEINLNNVSLSIFDV